MEKNKQKQLMKECCPITVSVILGLVGTPALGFLKGLDKEACLSSAIFMGLCALLVGLYWLRLFHRKKLSYNNSEYPFRFWGFYFLGYLISLGCLYLPGGSWPMGAVFLMIALFGSTSLGFIAGSILLLLPCWICGVGYDIFVLYFLCGSFAIVLFQNYYGEIRTTILGTITGVGFIIFPTLRNLFGGYVKDPAAWNAMLLGSVFNVVMMIFILYMFVQNIQYRNLGAYARLNDLEGPLLQKFKQESRIEYLRSLHTVYFCDKIAYKLGWNSDAMKCAAHYYKWGSDLPQLIKREEFPARASKILMDYYENETSDIPQVRYKETAALVCSDILVSTMIYVVNKDKNLPDYDVIVEAFFERMRKKGAFDKCEISGKDMYMIKELYKEEKYYYDSLRRK